jgi:hypothetical protein
MYYNFQTVYRGRHLYWLMLKSVYSKGRKTKRFGTACRILNAQTVTIHRHVICHHHHHPFQY